LSQHLDLEDGALVSEDGSALGLLDNNNGESDLLLSLAGLFPLPILLDDPLVAKSSGLLAESSGKSAIKSTLILRESPVDHSGD
jgi:hypothetical protein